MVEKARRSAVPSDERGNPTPQWEVFVRNEPGDPMRHVGSVAAANATEAHEHASRLFGWYAADVWLCPADAIERRSTRGLTAAVEDGTTETVGDGADLENADDDDDSESEEPRVYEETEGTPEVRDA
ncbi:phenylacetic acid degradation B [Natrinema sp. CBA1119]|uniref:Htur_1727 family rSAM-partnered candidate RiPP n=1 Tax=Natrinema sp. CBA1119 TaxID=1608465 RepID=UPI000BF842C0|nr:Htur_1727 family rSAM-partnered candidate RiPP [Natrinema sp. CBA1119]PGF14708.1 phenylacetic acid degradation B [Natrinema sp. CBA1119]